ncbi:phosphatidate cytidylyltransferase [Glomus cerebriforme]|uniref:Phosphatidate cytidylyltransferase n=1 Tax=Glomus cerebriforme TaxID=658196 RepID=A0A397T8P4_9GLOM|nr:phosphatidate cytidylyltransferase [Glomus cerebriforme]
MFFLPPPTFKTLKALVISYLYASTLLLTVEIIQRTFKISIHITRKVIHVLSGLFMFFLLYLFEQWEYVVFLTGSFVIINYIFLRMRMVRSMDPLNGATLGTVYFAFSCAFLFGWFNKDWERGFPRGREYLAIAGIMAMTFGDASASIIGRKYGTHRVMGRKTIEGSLANFVVTMVAVPFFWYILSPPTLATRDYFTGALISASVSTCLEAISPMGSDNLTVPLGVAFTLSRLGY